MQALIAQLEAKETRLKALEELASKHPSPRVFAVAIECVKTWSSADFPAAIRAAMRLIESGACDKEAERSSIELFATRLLLEAVEYGKKRDEGGALLYVVIMGILDRFDECREEINRFVANRRIPIKDEVQRFLSSSIAEKFKSR